MPEIGIADKETLDKINTNVGAKTDAASSTESLHAKVRDAKNAINAGNSTVNTINTNVGAKADAASATGSLHAKAADIKSYLTSKVNNIPGDVWGHGSRGPSATVAGNTVRLSADVERGGSSTYYKRIKVNVTGMVRAKFELKGKGRATLSYVLETSETIYTVDVDNYSSYTSYSKDFSVCAGDVISLRTSPADERTLYMRNFRLCWEYSSAPVTGRVLVD